MGRKKKKKVVQPEYDWEAIKVQYRVTDKSFRVLSQEFGPHHETIRRKAKKEGWVRDKTDEVRALTNAALIKAAGGGDRGGDTDSDVSPTDIKIAVATNVEVVLGHQKTIRKLKKIEDQLIEELGGDPKKLHVFHYKGDPVMIETGIAIPELASTYQRLVSAVSTRIERERQVLNLDAKQQDTGNSVADAIREAECQRR